ncbi:hypothetical protein AB0M02_34120 [Actinoplanes sp. NPDC051861]|uniref:hypothetical protein n=1 Tax=Actinoplanes sp. NPDC051861 TaxID=3155170 RepID=UPI0034215B2D
MRRGLIVSGTLIMGYAVIGALGADPAGMLLFGLAVLVVHDFVFLPVVLATGELIRRTVPPAWQATVRLVAIIDVTVLVVALPLVLGLGRDAGNPTVLPRPYTMGLILIVVLTGVTAALIRKGFERSRGRPRK